MGYKENPHEQVRQIIEIDPRLTPIDLVIKTAGDDLVMTFDMRPPKGIVIPEIQTIYDREEKRRALSAITKSARRFYSSAVMLEGTLSGELGTIDSESIDRPQSATSRNELTLSDTIDNALKMDIPFETILRKLRETGMTVQVGETHMGEITLPVQEQMTEATGMAADVYRKAGKLPKQYK